MVFAYYNRLSAARKRIYRQSDAIPALRLPETAAARALARQLPAVLERGDCRETASLCRRIAGCIVAELGAPPVSVRVLAVRPADDHGELHGLYEPRAGRRRAAITLWMRTARRRRVVAFRTFLRTLLHEVCHHLDYEYLGLDESLHTEGFYRRESSLFRQLVEDREDR